MRPRRAWTSVAAPIVVLCGVAGCADPDGPSPIVARAQCVVGDEQGEVIVLPGSLTAPEAGTVLGQARPDEPVNLEVVEQAVVAFGGRAEVQGVITDYPPAPNADLADSLARWDERRPLPGLRIGPADGQQAVLVALRLVDPDQPGHLDGVTLESSEDGDARTVTFEQPLLVEPPGRLCTVEDVDATREWVGP